MKEGEKIMKQQILIMLLLIVVCTAGGFFGGMKYQQSQRTTGRQQFFGNGQMMGQTQNGTNGGQGRTRMGGGQITGEILNLDDKSITIKMQDGSSRIVIVSDTTTINKATEGTKTDLKVGQRVAAFGTSNTDGSITAQNIQLNPPVRVGTGGGTPRP